MAVNTSWEQQMRRLHQPHRFPSYQDGMNP
jgi:hypothetical protein